MQPNIVLSGSDDATLKVHDTSIAQGTALTLFSDRRTHGSGVTTLSPHPRLPYLLASGSYDESVRLWDIRQPSKPLLQAQVRTCPQNLVKYSGVYLWCVPPSVCVMCLVLGHAAIGMLTIPTASAEAPSSSTCTCNWPR